MLDHLLACLPEEACGLLGGRLGLPASGHPARCQAVLPVPNALHSPVRFRMDPAEQLKAFYWFEEHGLDLVAIFHSHPGGPGHPSATDLAEFAYPGTFYLIWSPGPPETGWQLNAFHLSAGAYCPYEIEYDLSSPSSAEG